MTLGIGLFKLISLYLIPGSTTIHSELFKYVHRDGSWTSFQRIRTFGAKDIKHFQFKADDGRMEHFLAVANHCVRGKWIQMNSVI